MTVYNLTQRKYKKVESVEHLKKLCGDGHTQYFISFGGVARSSKEIEYNAETETFYVFSGISGEWMDYSERELMQSPISNIGIAIINNRFYVELN